MTGSLALRIVLAVAHDRSNGDRAPFDAFWIACRDLHWRAINKTTGNHERGVTTERAWCNIAEAMGYSITPELRQRVRNTVDPRKRRQRKLASDAHSGRER